MALSIVNSTSAVRRSSYRAWPKGQKFPVNDAKSWQIGRIAFGGTTAEQTISHATVPVLVANSPPASHYKRVLFTAKLDTVSAAARTAAVSRIVGLRNFILENVGEVSPTKMADSRDERG